MRLQLEEEDLEDRAAEDDYEQMLDKEAQKLRIRGFEPKVSTGAKVTLTNCALSTECLPPCLGHTNDLKTGTGFKG